MTGLVLILLAVGLWIAEVFVPGFGILGIGSLVAFLLGSLILFEVPGEYLFVDPQVLSTACPCVVGAASVHWVPVMYEEE